MTVSCKYNGRMADLKNRRKGRRLICKVVQAQEQVHLNWLRITDCWKTGSLLTTSSEALQSFSTGSKAVYFKQSISRALYLWRWYCLYIKSGGLFFPLTQNLMWLQVMPPICNAPLSEMGTATSSMARSGGAVVSVET